MARIGKTCMYWHRILSYFPKRFVSQEQCRSARSWPDYYAAHEKQVYARIEELVNERAGD